MELTRTAIGVQHLSKRVADASGELTILHEIDFTAQAGETLAIVGASGSGKSTLLGILAGLDTPSHGKVILDGVDIFALDEDGRAGFRKEKLGFVFQSFQLLMHLNALENVMLPLELRGDKRAREKAEEMLAHVGLASRYAATVILKGSGSVIAQADGEVIINHTGNPALATAGTGDILAGICGSLLIGEAPAFDIAGLAVCLHGLAADRLVAQGIGPLGITSGELIHAVRNCLNEMLADSSEAADAY